MTSPDFSNKTLYGTDTKELRSIWAGWLIVFLFPSILGNITILLASLKYRAIKLHRVVVMFIEHIAMLDFILALTCLIPKVVSLLVNRWVFGEALCYAVVFITYYGHCTNLMYICTFTTCKWLILTFPLRSKFWFRKQYHTPVCFAIWVLAATFPIAFLIIDKSDISFDYRTYLCAYRYTSKKWDLWIIILSVILGFLPMTILLTVTTLLTRYLIRAKKSAERTSGSFRWQGLITVLLTAALYMISYLPFASYVVVATLMKQKRADVTTTPGYILYYRISKETMWCSSTYNIFIYAFTVKSFRDFLRGKVTERLSRVSLSGRKCLF